MDGLQQDTALIRALVEFADMPPARVAKAAGVAVTTINRPFTGTAPSRLGRSVLEKLQAAFPDFPGWRASVATLAGVGDERLPWIGPPKAANTDLVEVAQIDLRYGLGGTYLDGPVEIERQQFSRAWLAHFTRSPADQLFWTVGEGDSMEPTIRSGEMVLIDRSQATPRMADGIWALTMGEIGMIKRLHFPRKGVVQLVSDNARVPLIEVAIDELHVVGRVVAVVRRL